MDDVNAAIQELVKWPKDCRRLLTKCSKPNRAEFLRIFAATGIGFCIMGFIGFFVKLIHNCA